MIDVDVPNLTSPETVLPRILVLSVLLNRSVRIGGVGDFPMNHLQFATELVETTASACVTEEGNGLVVNPGNGPSAGEYEFDLTRYKVEGRPTVPEVWPLLVVLLSRAQGESTVRLRGVTHGTSSPGMAFARSALASVYEPLGYRCRISLKRWGFAPEGEGLLQGTIEGKGSPFDSPALAMDERGAFVDLDVTSAVGNLPAEVLRRQTREVRDRLAEAGFAPTVDSVPAESRQPGTAVELTARYEEVTVSFSAVGEPDKRAETVAREAVSKFLDYHRGDAPVSRILAPELVVPLLLSCGRSVFLTVGVTRRLKELVALANQFHEGTVFLEGETDVPGRVVVEASE